MTPVRPPMPGSLPTAPPPRTTTTPPASGLTAAAASIDKPTLALIRRVLCSHALPSTPLEDLLPVLTPSSEIDLQVWALLAVVVRDFVASWYGTITNDTELVTEVVKVVGVVVAGVAARVGKIDLSVLLLDELPAVLENHINDFRLAQARTGTSLAPNLTHAQIFHNMQPHPALAASPASERLHLKLVSSGLLAVLLPPGDLESDCERSLLREILGSMVLWNAIDKLSEPSALYDIITKLLGLLAGGGPPTTSPPDPSPEKPEPKPTNGSRRRSSAASKTAFTITTSEKTPLAPAPAPTPTPPPPPSLSIPPALDTLLTLASRALGLLRTFLATLLHTLHTPSAPPTRPKPLLRMSIFRLASTYLSLPSQQPWLVGTLLLLSRPFTSRATAPGAVLDTLLSAAVHARLSEPSIIAMALCAARETLFMPAGLLPPPPGEARSRQLAEEAIVDAVPRALRTLWGEDVGARCCEVWAVKEVNKHLMYQVLDLVVARVAPELGEAGPAEVRRGRVGVGVEVGV